MATKTKNRQQQKSNKQSQQSQSSSKQTQQQLQKRVDATIKRLESKDPGLKKLLEKAYGYAVFPSVGKAALVVGGSYGRGAVFEKGKMIGYATISQMTIGVQIGGDTFTEILVFHDKGSLKRFKQGRMAFAANALAVLVKAAAAGTSDFKGVNALAYSSGGMLLELSLGGQKFTFKPLGEEDENQQRQGKGAQSKRGGEEEADEDEEQDDQGEEGGMLGRALSGVKGVTEAAKARPIAATLVGAGLVAGLAILAMRALRGGGSASQRDGEDEEDYEDDEETDARGSGEDDDDDEDEWEDDDDDDDDRDDDDDDDDDEGDGDNNHLSSVIGNIVGNLVGLGDRLN